MTHRSLFCNGFIVLGLLTAMSQAAARQTLIYSESSTLTDPVADGWAAASQTDGLAVSVRDPAGFLTELWSAPWDRVVLIGHATIDSAVLHAALSDFAQARPSSIVVITLLDNRFLPSQFYANADVPVVTTIWNHGFWATQYLGIVANDPADLQPQSGRGYEFPTFQGVEVVRPPLGRNESGTGMRARDQDRGQSPDPCEQCQLDYNRDLAECNTDRDDHVDMCDDVYGPGGSEPNPDLYNTCISSANATHTACVNGATQRFKLCRKRFNCDPPPPDR